METHTDDKSGVLYSRVKGEIDINSSPQLKKDFEPHMTKGEAKIVIDLSEVPYIDSSGLATLVEILKNVRKSKGTLILIGLSDKIKGLFEITKLDKLFTILGTEEEAIAKLA